MLDRSIKEIAIIGGGLIGGSIGLALRRKKTSRKVAMCSRRNETVKKIRKLKAADVATTSLEKSLKSADLIIVAVPVNSIVPITKKIIPLAKKGAIITDVGSIKEPIVRECQNLAQAQIHFVGGHPMAGAEKSGIAQARRDLFDGASCILTPTKRTDSRALQIVRGFWQSLGASVEIMNPARHDQIVADISHLPHLVSFYLIQCAHAADFKFAAGSFRDMTRIAESSPEQWRDICFANRVHLLHAAKKMRTFLNKAIKTLGQPRRASTATLLSDFKAGARLRALYLEGKK